MIFNVYPSGAVELEDQPNMKFVVNGKRVNHYNVKGSRVAKVEFIHFKDATW